MAAVYHHATDSQDTFQRCNQQLRYNCSQLGSLVLREREPLLRKNLILKKQKQSNMSLISWEWNLTWVFEQATSTVSTSVWRQSPSWDIVSDSCGWYFGETTTVALRDVGFNIVSMSCDWCMEYKLHLVSLNVHGSLSPATTVYKYSDEIHRINRVHNRSNMRSMEACHTKSDEEIICTWSTSSYAFNVRDPEHHTYRGNITRSY